MIFELELRWLDILFILFLIDSIGALWVAFFGERWFVHHVGVMAKYFPPAKGWAILYFVLSLLLVLLSQGIL